MIGVPRHAGCAKLPADTAGGQHTLPQACWGPNLEAMDVVDATETEVDTSGPRPTVRGTDIKVSQIASEYELQGMTPDQIVEAHPHLSLAAVHTALAYYYDRSDQIRREWREERALIDVLRGKYQRTAESA